MWYCFVEQLASSAIFFWINVYSTASVTNVKFLHVLSHEKNDRNSQLFMWHLRTANFVSVWKWTKKQQKKFSVVYFWTAGQDLERRGLDFGVFSGSFIRFFLPVFLLTFLGNILFFLRLRDRLGHSEAARVLLLEFISPSYEFDVFSQLLHDKARHIPRYQHKFCQSFVFVENLLQFVPAGGKVKLRHVHN